MTVIAFDGCNMAADREFKDDSGHSGLIIKVLKHKGCLLGGAGPTQAIQWMFEWFQAGANLQAWPKIQTQEDNWANMLLAKPDGSIWMIEKYPIWLPLQNKFYAIGSGAPVAMGAMGAGANARLAVELAVAYSPGCGGGCDEISLDS